MTDATDLSESVVVGERRKLLDIGYAQQDPSSPYRAKTEIPLITDLLTDAGDGVTDCSATFARTDVDSFVLPAGDYRITSSCTIQRPLDFMAGARVTIDTNAVVTFGASASVSADSRRQIFYGAGAVIGLRLVDETWFVGDKLYSLEFDYITHDVTTPSALLGPNADVELQRAADAVRENGKYLCHTGVLSLSGENLIAFNRQVEIVGDIRTSLYMWTSLKTNGFALNKQRSKISGVWFRKYAMDQFATEGAALYVNSSQIQANNFMISGAYIGVSQQNQAGGFYSTFEVMNSKAAGFVITNVNDTVVSSFIINGGDELGSFTEISGTWSDVQYGDQLTGVTSGAKFVARHINPAGRMYMAKNYNNAQQPIIGEAYTNARTGARATLTAYDYPHDQAGMCLFQTGGPGAIGNFTEGAFVSNGDIINGLRSLLILGSGTGYREGPSFNTFTGVFFDSALAEGLKLDRTDGVTFTGCWLASRLDGFNVDNGRNIQWFGGDIRDSARKAGHITGPASSNIEFHGARVLDNLNGVPGTVGAHITINHDFAGHLAIYGGRWGRSAGTMPLTDAAITFLPNGASPGATNAHFTWLGGECRGFRYFPIGNLTGVSNYWVQGVLGARLKARGTAVIPTTAINTTFAHGMPYTPEPSIVRLGVNSVNAYGSGAALVPSAVSSTNITVALVDADGDSVTATKNVNFWWEIDQSYNAIN